MAPAQQSVASPRSLPLAQPVPRSEEWHRGHRVALLQKLDHLHQSFNSEYQVSPS